MEERFLREISAACCAIDHMMVNKQYEHAKSMNQSLWVTVEDKIKQLIK